RLGEVTAPRDLDGHRRAAALVDLSRLHGGREHELTDVPDAVARRPPCCGRLGDGDDKIVRLALDVAAEAPREEALPSRAGMELSSAQREDRDLVAHLDVERLLADLCLADRLSAGVGEQREMPEIRERRVASDHRLKRDLGV